MLRFEPYSGWEDDLDLVLQQRQTIMGTRGDEAARKLRMRLSVDIEVVDVPDLPTDRLVRFLSVALNRFDGVSGVDLGLAKRIARELHERIGEKI